MRQFECAAPWVVVVMCGFVQGEPLPAAGAPPGTVALEILLVRPAFLELKLKLKSAAHHEL